MVVYGLEDLVDVMYLRGCGKRDIGRGKRRNICRGGGKRVSGKGEGKRDIGRGKRSWRDIGRGEGTRRGTGREGEGRICE